MKKNWVGISVIGCSVASLLMLGMAWKKQHEKVQLELKEKDAKCWIENDYRRRDRIKELDKQARVWALGGMASISWPFALLFAMDVKKSEARARMRRIKRRMARRQR